MVVTPACTLRLRIGNPGPLCSLLERMDAAWATASTAMERSFFRALAATHAGRVIELTVDALRPGVWPATARVKQTIAPGLHPAVSSSGRDRRAMNAENLLLPSLVWTEDMRMTSPSADDPEAAAPARPTRKDRFLAGAGPSLDVPIDWQACSWGTPMRRKMPSRTRS
jgi:hypothetical protein